MSNVIYGNMVGGGAAPLKTLILEDESGNEVIGVVTGSEVIFTATDNDVRKDMIYASDNGVSIGTKVIPAYHTFAGTKVIAKGKTVTISTLNTDVDVYDYTKLQTLICLFNTNISNSVAAEKISVDDSVYNVKSTEAIATIVKDHDTKTINLNITNDSDKNWILRYFGYKEVV